MNKSTIIAGVGVLVFVVIMGIVVVVNSRGNNELGRVYNGEQHMGTAKEFKKLLNDAAVDPEKESDIHRALKNEFTASSDVTE